MGEIPNREQNVLSAPAEGAAKETFRNTLGVTTMGTPAQSAAPPQTAMPQAPNPQQWVPGPGGNVLYPPEQGPLTAMAPKAAQIYQKLRLTGDEPKKVAVGLGGAAMGLGAGIGQGLSAYMAGNSGGGSKPAAPAAPQTPPPVAPPKPMTPPPAAQPPAQPVTPQGQQPSQPPAAQQQATAPTWQALPIQHSPNDTVNWVEDPWKSVQYTVQNPRGAVESTVAQYGAGAGYLGGMDSEEYQQYMQQLNEVYKMQHNGQNMPPEFFNETTNSPDRPFFDWLGETANTAKGKVTGFMLDPDVQAALGALQEQYQAQAGPAGLQPLSGGPLVTEGGMPTADALTLFDWAQGRVKNELLPQARSMGDKYLGDPNALFQLDTWSGAMENPGAFVQQIMNEPQGREMIYSMIGNMIRQWFSNFTQGRGF